MPEIKLTKEESEKYFHSTLCNHFGVGGYGCEFAHTTKAYKKAKKTLQEKIEKGEIPHTMYHPEWDKKEGKKPSICREDVWMEILANGDKLKIIDLENGGSYTRSITLKEVHERVQKTPFKHLLDMMNEQDDADTADAILQTVFFEDIVFG